jgi:hypothetical protein
LLVELKNTASTENDDADNHVKSLALAINAKEAAADSPNNENEDPDNSKFHLHLPHFHLPHVHVPCDSNCGCFAIAL